MTDIEEFWVDVDLESEEMGKRLEKILDISYEVYQWSLDTVTDIWIREKEIPKVGSLSKELTQYIKDKPWYGKIQRYTLNRILEGAITQFTQQTTIDQSNKVNFPTRIPKDEYKSFLIPSRKIWKKYLENYSRISTAYGTLYMLGEWIKITQAQAKYNRVTMDYLPYLWHSVTIRQCEDGWKIHFNLHKIDSHQGKIAERRMKRERFKAI